MNKNRIVIYHNPDCSKSREALQILEDRNAIPDIVEYLDQPPTRQELKQLIEMLGVTAREVLRTTEQIYEDAKLGDVSLSEEEIIEAICEHPALLQRPIVVAGNRAIIGRPPARVLEIIA